MATVPTLTISGELGAENSLGISYLQGLDLDVSVDGPILDSGLTGLETYVPQGNDVTTSIASLP
jgi:hypothetical protein